MYDLTICNATIVDGTGAPAFRGDVAAGGRRLGQKTTGYTATVCNDEVTRENGEHAGVMPGRLNRRGVLR